jgi:hypothetical protein
MIANPAQRQFAARRVVTNAEKAAFKKKLEKLQERDSEMVTGIFKNLENPGGSVQFNYKCYEGEDYLAYELRDGERYVLPRGVARHLNTNCYYKEYKHLGGEFGETGIRAGFNDGRLRGDKMQASRKIHRYAFHSLEFMDDELDMKPSNLVEVTVSP